MIYKLLGGLIVVAALILALLTVKDDLSLNFLKAPVITDKAEPCIQLTPAEQLKKLIDDDFENLKDTQELPAEWEQIAIIEYRISSDLAKALLGRLRPNFPQIKGGTASLELEIMDIPDDENPGFIIQASLFDIRSKNKIFEIGRTYNMEDLNHQNKGTAESSATPQPQNGSPNGDSKSQ